jgi:hypothetical protein
MRCQQSTQIGVEASDAIIEVKTKVAERLMEAEVAAFQK